MNAEVETMIYACARGTMDLPNDSETRADLVNVLTMCLKSFPNMEDFAITCDDSNNKDGGNLLVDVRAKLKGDSEYSSYRALVTEAGVE